MKRFMIGLLLCSGMAHAEPLKVSVTDFNFTYQNPHGEGTATSFASNKLFGEEVSVSVDRIDQDLKFTVSGSQNLEFDLKNAPSFMTEADTMSVSTFNMALAEKLFMSLGSGRFNSKNDSLKLDGLTLECARDLSKEDLAEQLATGCLQRMSFKTSKFSSEEGLAEVLKASLSETLNDKANLGINSLEFKVTSGKFDFSAGVKAQVSGKVKSSGTILYEHQAGKVTVKISEIKFGILNITGKVFDELKKQETEKFKVKEPFLYYSLK
jgi:hypothetical protein